MQTTIASKLAAVGYATHQIGKWDCGMATFRHTPLGRGYSTSFGYFHHSNDYWDETLNRCTDSGGATRFPVDLWLTDMPAHGLNGTTNGSAIEDYEEWKFGQRAVSIIESHAPSTPLFLNYDFHIAHEKLEVPDEYANKSGNMAAWKVGAGRFSS